MSIEESIDGFKQIVTDTLSSIEDTVNKQVSRGVDSAGRIQTLLEKTSEFSEETLTSGDFEISLRIQLASNDYGPITKTPELLTGIDPSLVYRIDTEGEEKIMTLDPANFLAEGAEIFFYQDHKAQFDLGPLVVVAGNIGYDAGTVYGDDLILESDGTIASAVALNAAGAAGAFARMDDRDGKRVWLHIRNLSLPKTTNTIPYYTENAMGKVWVNSDGSIEMLGKARNDSSKQLWPLDMSAGLYRLASFITSAAVDKETRFVSPVVTDANLDVYTTSTVNYTVSQYIIAKAGYTFSHEIPGLGFLLLELYISSSVIGYRFNVTDASGTPLQNVGTVYSGKITTVPGTAISAASLKGLRTFYDNGKLVVLLSLAGQVHRWEAAISGSSISYAVAGGALDPTFFGWASGSAVYVNYENLIWSNNENTCYIYDPLGNTFSDTASVDQKNLVSLNSAANPNLYHLPDGRMIKISGSDMKYSVDGTVVTEPLDSNYGVFINSRAFINGIRFLYENKGEMLELPYNFVNGVQTAMVASDNSLININQKALPAAVNVFTITRINGETVKTATVAEGLIAFPLNHAEKLLMAIKPNSVIGAASSITIITPNTSVWDSVETVSWKAVWIRN